MSLQHNTDKTDSFQADGHATLIGSIPLSSHNDALDLIFKHTPRIPLWPQLPENRQEGMLIQYNEGLPAIDTDDTRVYFNTASDQYEADQLSFYEEYLAITENFELLHDSRFKMSRDYAEGLYQLIENRSPEHDSIIALKGQITGPFTLLTSLKDQNDRPGYYDPMIRDMITKGLALKAAWQVSFLKQQNDNIIIFIDEPALAGLGSSSFISISKEDIAQDQTEVIEAIHTAGGLAGVHVCANSDWPLLLSLGYDILNFDAYGFFDRLIACKDDVYAFLSRGGIIAWGLIPTSNEEHIIKESGDSLTSQWEDQAAQLVNDQWSLTKILKQSLITPSCGTGSLTPDLAARVLQLTQTVSENLRNKYL